MTKNTNNENKKKGHGLIKKMLPCCYGSKGCSTCQSTASLTKEDTEGDSKTDFSINTSQRKLNLSRSAAKSSLKDKKGGRRKCTCSWSSSSILLLAFLLTVGQAAAIVYTVVYLP